jgi:hypothetical protein
VNRPFHFKKTQSAFHARSQTEVIARLPSRTPATAGRRLVTYVASSFRLLTSYFPRERITKAANAICLKDYSSFLRSKEAPA